MCGIVGYIGKRDAFPVLIEGLSSLEYRGYDSAGVALLDNDTIQVLKAKGKVEQLRLLAKKKLKTGATIGIAHTRWATHGVPSEANAHPHTDTENKIALVHNGIIENYALLKEKLKREGVAFRSETDTEVLAQLVGKFYKGDLVEAVSQALALVEGTFGIAVIAHDNPDMLVGARRGSPLVVGVGEGEYFLASDASAIVRYTKSVIYLKDSSLVALSRQGHTTMDLDKKVVTHEIQHIDYTAPKRLPRAGFRISCSRRFSSNPTRSAMPCGDGCWSKKGMHALTASTWFCSSCARSTGSSSPPAARPGTRRLSANT